MFHPSSECRFNFLAKVLTAFFLVAGPTRAETYYLAPDGSDRNEGSKSAPLGSFDRAISLAEPGDTIHVRGGTYQLSGPVRIDRAGSRQQPIKLFAAAGEHPILDFGSNPRHTNPPQPREDDSVAATSDAIGILITGSAQWWHLKGLTVRHAPYYGVRIYGSNNVLEQMTMHANKASGLELTGKEGFRPSHNLVLNCDSHHNFDPQTNGEDADGFAAKFDSLGPGNVFRGLRAWSNSDDGFDFWHAAHPLRIENCWAFDNGFSRPEWKDQVKGRWQGDGLGFKLGQDAAELTLNRVVAFGNKAFGIDENGNRSKGGVVINHATLVNNAKDGNPVQIQLNDGRPHKVRNSIAFDTDGQGVADFSPSVEDASNSWNGIGASAADFISIDMSQLLAAGVAPRNPDGSLPSLGLQLAPASRLIDAGIDIGFPFQGSAPDVGAFETGEVSTPERLPLAARQMTIDKASLERKAAELVKDHGNDLRVSMWLGGTNGAAWFETESAATLPTASAIKAFYLVELFDRYKDKLDEELAAARAVLKDDEHPAISHFTPQQREEIRRELTGASVRRIGEVMIGKTEVSNAVYNAAANITTAVLGGPEALTEAIRNRDAAFKLVAARRYMLRDRTMPGDNVATARSLASLHQRLASAKLAGIDNETMRAIRDVLRWSDNEQGRHFAKAGNLNSDPLTAVRAGWWETPGGSFVYVAIAVQPTPGTKTREEAGQSLRQAAGELQEMLVTAGRKALEASQ